MSHFPDESDQREVRFANAVEGAQLAYHEIPGPGLAIINPLSHGATLEGVRRAPGQRGFLDAMGAGHHLAWYDQRGAGGSASAGNPVGWDQRGADLWAVAGATGIERAVLYGVFDAGHTIIHAALQQPERVLGLIFNRVPASFAAAPDDSGSVSAADLDQWFHRDDTTPLGRTQQLMEAIGIGKHDAEMLTDAWQRTATVEAVAQQEMLLRQADARPMLGRLEAPALLLAPRRKPRMARWVEAFGSALPAARTVYAENGGEALGAIHGFLSILSADVGRLASRLPAALSSTMNASKRSVGELRRILVPVDANISSGHAVEMACRLGEAQKAEILLVHVVTVPYVLPLDHPLPEASFRGDRALTLGEAIVAEHDLSCRTILLTERSAAGAIVRLARDEHADLLVMGSGGTSFGGSSQVGRTAQEVLRRASCEVLLDRGEVR